MHFRSPVCRDPIIWTIRKDLCITGLRFPIKTAFFISPAHYASVVYCALAECGRISYDAIEKFQHRRLEYGNDRRRALAGIRMYRGIAWSNNFHGLRHGPRPQAQRRRRQSLCPSLGRRSSGRSGCWEAMQASYFYHLDNLVIYVDVNGQQVEGSTDEVMDMGRARRALPLIRVYGRHSRRPQRRAIDCRFQTATRRRAVGRVVQNMWCARDSASGASSSIHALCTNRRR